MSFSVTAVTDALLDSTWLSERLGRRVEATSIRIKPGTMVVVAWKAVGFPASVEHAGWAQISAVSYRDKALKHAKRAMKLGAEVSSVELDTDLVPTDSAGSPYLLQWGSVFSDPKLYPVLAGVSLPGSARLLRYNQLRRLVVSYEQDGAPVVTRVLAKPTRSADLYAALAEALPIPELRSSSDDSLVTSYAWVGTHDVQKFAEASGDAGFLARATGQLFGKLHSIDLSGGRLQEVPLVQDPGLAAHRNLLELFAPEFCDRFDELAGAVRPLTGIPVLSHGDASPDQVLFDEPSGRLWMTDFDRVCRAPAATDLGAYLATSSPDSHEDFLAGYLEVARSVPLEEDLQQAKIHSIFNRLMDPLRKASPTWRDEVSQNLDVLEQEVSSCP